MSATMPKDRVTDTLSDSKPYVINRLDRWIILVIVLVVGWFMFRPIFAVVTAYRGVTFESALFPDTAEHYYRKAIAIDKAVPDGWIHLGELFYYWNRGQTGRFRQAADIFEAGMKACPTSSKLAFDLGRTYLIKLKDYKKAEAALREAVRRDPNDEFAWDYLGYAAVNVGDRQYALECWRQVLRINPAHDSARKALQQYGG
jgi:tetratricopeptide (TPR) repeat protein